MERSEAVQAGLILICGILSASAGYMLFHLRRSEEPWGTDGLLGMGLAILGVAIISAWFLAFLVALASELLLRRGHATAAQVTARHTPTVMLRLAVAFLGVNLLTVPAVAQAALQESVGMSIARSDSSYRQLPPIPPVEGGPDDEQPAPGIQPPVSPAWKPSPIPADGGLLLRPEMRSSTAAGIVVVAGDSLWSIVADRLGPLATAADVAEAWPVWYEANRCIIGDDPALLIPGQVLHSPPG